MTISTLASAATLGWVAGMRSMTAPALASDALTGAHTFPARQLAHPLVRRGLAVAALGELVADKLPMTPSRTSPPALIGRLGSGVVVGAAIAAARGDSRVVAALVGGAMAVASSFLMESLRAETGRHTETPDPVVAVGEDALAVALGSLAARQ